MTLRSAACARKRWPRCWNRRMKTPTSVRLLIFMTAAAPTIQPGPRCLNCTTSPARCPHPDRALDEFAAAWQSEAPPQDTPWGRAVLQSAARRVQGALRLIEAALTAAARDETADRAYTAVLSDDESKLTLLAERLHAGDWDRALEALSLLKEWRRPGAIKGGRDGNPAALAAYELRERAKKADPETAERFPAVHGGPNSRPTAAAPRRWWRRLCGRCACLPRPFLPPRSRKKSSTMPTMSTSLSICCRRRKGSARRCAPRSARAMRRCLSMNTRTPTPCRTRFIFRSPRPRPITSSSSATSSRASTASARPTQAFLPPSRRPGSLTRTRRRSRSHARPRSRWTPTSAAPRRSSRALTTSLRPFSPRRSAASPTAPGQRLVVGRPGEYRGLCEISVLDGADAAADAAAIAQRIAEMQRQGFTVRGKDGPPPLCVRGLLHPAARPRGLPAL